MNKRIAYKEKRESWTSPNGKKYRVVYSESDIKQPKINPIIYLPETTLDCPQKYIGKFIAYNSYDNWGDPLIGLLESFDAVYYQIVHLKGTEDEWRNSVAYWDMKKLRLATDKESHKYIKREANATE